MGGEEGENEHTRYYYGRLTPGNYDSASDLVKGLNAAVDRALRLEFSNEATRTRKPRAMAFKHNDPRTSSALLRKDGSFFRYDPVTHKISSHTDNTLLARERTTNRHSRIDAYVVYLHPELYSRLGYTQYVSPTYEIGDWEKRHGPYWTGQLMAEADTAIYGQVTGAATCDPNVGFHNIYVYSDIMKESHVVGNTVQPCLRVVPTNTGERNRMVLYEPTHMYFFPLRTNSLHDVEVILLTDAGDDVPFDRGNAVVTVKVQRVAPFGA